MHARDCNVHKRACTFLYLVIAFKQCRVWGWWIKWKLLRRVQCILTTILTLLQQYVHACKQNQHECAYRFLYLSLAIKKCRIRGCWRKWKFLRRVQCKLFALLEQYLYACKCNAHNCPCKFLYLAIVFKQCRIWEGWQIWKLFGRVQCILTTYFAPLNAFGTGPKWKLYSIYSTLLRNFHFLHSYQILHCLKTIAKYRNVNACLFALCLHAYTYCSRSAKIVWLYIGLSWATFIFFIIPKFYTV